MTEEQGEQAVNQTPAVKPLAATKKRLQAAKRKPKPPVNTEAARAAVAANRPVKIELSAPHFINGVAYGPGVVTVPQHMVNGLLETERRLRENNANFEGKRAHFIGPGGRAMPVPYDAMDSPMLNVLEALTIQ